MRSNFGRVIKKLNACIERACYNVAQQPYTSHRTLGHANLDLACWLPLATGHVACLAPAPACCLRVRLQRGPCHPCARCWRQGQQAACGAADAATWEQARHAGRRCHCRCSRCTQSQTRSTSPIQSPTQSQPQSTTRSRHQRYQRYRSHVHERHGQPSRPVPPHARPSLRLAPAAVCLCLGPCLGRRALPCPTLAAAPAPRSRCRCRCRCTRHRCSRSRTDCPGSVPRAPAAVAGRCHSPSHRSQTRTAAPQPERRSRPGEQVCGRQPHATARHAVHPAVTLHRRQTLTDRRGGWWWQRNPPRGQLRRRWQRTWPAQPEPAVTPASPCLRRGRLRALAPTTGWRPRPPTGPDAWRRCHRCRP